MSHPLEGLRVLDASSFLSGPFAGLMLADLGAEVIKVEPTPNGDPFRRFGRREGGFGLNFLNANRNKLSVVVDLRSEDGRAELESLLASADILISNWRPGVAASLGLGDERVSRDHPRLIWIRISGFGPTGPDAHLPAFDSTIQARAGIAMAQGDDGGPQMVRSWLADKTVAQFATQAALAALYRRERTGGGAIVEVPMLDALAYFNFPDVWSERTLVGDDDRRPSINSQLRANRPVRTRDGWILLSPVGGKQMSAALEALDRASEKPMLRAINDAAEVAARFFDIAAQSMVNRTTVEWLSIFERFDVPAAAVLDFDQHVRDPQVLHNGIYREYDDPRLGRIRAPRYPARIGDADVAPLIAPAPDEHRDRLLGGT